MKLSNLAIVINSAAIALLYVIVSGDIDRKQAELNNELNNIVARIDMLDETVQREIERLEIETNTNLTETKAQINIVAERIKDTAKEAKIGNQIEKGIDGVTEKVKQGVVKGLQGLSEIIGGENDNK